MSGTAVGTPLRGHRKWVTSLAFEPLHACSPVKPGKSTSASTQRFVVIICNVAILYFAV